MIPTVLISIYTLDTHPACLHNIHLDNVTLQEIYGLIHKPTRNPDDDAYTN